MAEIKIRDVNEETIKLLDEIAKKEKYSSRNQLLLDILNLYVSAQSSFTAKSLPAVTRYLCEEIIESKTDEMNKSVIFSLTAIKDIQNKIDKLYALFYNESK